MLQGNENIRVGFPLSITLKISLAESNQNEIRVLKPPTLQQQENNLTSYVAMKLLL